MTDFYYFCGHEQWQPETLVRHAALAEDAPRLAAAQDTWYVINGTPTDCVHLAITGLFDHEFTNPVYAFMSEATAAECPDCKS